MSIPLQAREIPLDRIRVINPRSRGRASHEAIVESIAAVGLKRPITVAARPEPDGEAFDLVCGQGRLEAYRRLGQASIPAVVLELSEEDCLVRSLVENVARRRYAGPELVGDVLRLREAGRSDADIAAMIGLSESWVGKIALLLERAEAELIRAVECGYLPLSLAVAIACEPDEEVQRTLAGAYRAGLVRIRDVPRVRRLLARRAKPAAGVRAVARSAEEVMGALQRRAERQRLAVKRADVLEARLAFVLGALRDIWAEEGFADLLAREGLQGAPKALVERVGRAHG